MYCKKCGLKLIENDSFCRNCGTPVTIQNNVEANKMTNNNKTKFSWLTKLSLFFLIINICLLIISYELGSDWGVAFNIMPLPYNFIMFLLNRNADIKGHKTSKTFKAILLFLPLIPVIFFMFEVLNDELIWKSKSNHTQTIEEVSVTFPSDFELFTYSTGISDGVTFSNDNGCDIEFDVINVKYGKNKDFLTQFKDSLKRNLNISDINEIYLSDIDINGQIWKYYHGADGLKRMYAYSKQDYFYSINMKSFKDSVDECGKKLNEVLESVEYK